MYRLVNFSGAFCSKSNVTGTSLVDGASQKWHSLQKAPGIYTSDEEVNVTGVGNLRMGPLKQMIPHHPFSNPDLQWSASFFNINTPLVVIYALICDAAETYWTRIFVTEKHWPIRTYQMKCRESNVVKKAEAKFIIMVGFMPQLSFSSC